MHPNLAQDDDDQDKYWIKLQKLTIYLPKQGKKTYI